MANPSETEKKEIAVALLYESREWRVRAVERIEVTSASWSDRRRSTQATELKDLVSNNASIKPWHTHVTLYLPVGNFPKSPLLDFDVTVAGEPAFVLPREEQSKLHTWYISFLASQVGVAIDSSITSLLTAIFAFPAGPWQNVHQSMHEEYEQYERATLELLVWQYLMSSSSWNFQVSQEMVQDWLSIIDPIHKWVSKSVPSSIDSASENPVLALPDIGQMFANELQVASLLGDLNSLLSWARNQQVAQTRRLLKAYAAYGRYWDMFVECTIPLDEPFMIKTAEKRGLHLGEPGKVANSHSKPSQLSLQKTSSQLVVFNDAMTNHLNVRVNDTNVELVPDKVRVLNERYEPVGEEPDFQQSSPELLSFYSADEGRKHRIWVDIPLRPSGHAAITRWVVVVLSASALLAFIFFVYHWFDMAEDSKMTGQDVAVILVPSAIAASLLLVRESSTLGAEINKEIYYVTSLILVGLWFFTLTMYAFNKIDWGLSPPVLPDHITQSPSVTSTATR
ncbi:hypothetical protein ACWCPI_35735 [Streptomyces sp. NPDC001920]